MMSTLNAMGRSCLLLAGALVVVVVLSACGSAHSSGPASATRGSPTSTPFPLPSSYSSPGSEAQLAVSLLLQLQDLPNTMRQVLDPKPSTVADLFAKQIQDGTETQAEVDGWQVTGGAVSAFQEIRPNSALVLVGPNVITFANSEGATAMFQKAKQNLTQNSIAKLEQPKVLESYEAFSTPLGDEAWVVHWQTKLLDNFQIVMRHGRVVASVFIRGAKGYTNDAAIGVAAKQEARLEAVSR